MHVYPMYENALRWHRGQSPLENLEESSSLYGQFADIASKHPMAWNSGKSPKTAKEIGSITKNNRMICFPCGYPLSIMWKLWCVDCSHTKIHCWWMRSTTWTLLVLVSLLRQSVPYEWVSHAISGFSHLGVEEQRIPKTVNSPTRSLLSGMLSTWLINWLSVPIVWARPNFYTSRAIASALDLCLHSSGLIKDDIDLFDFYSWVYIHWCSHPVWYQPR